MDEVRDGAPKRSSPEHRRSVRVDLSGFPVELVGAGRALVTNLGLGGARLLSNRRFVVGERDWLILEYDKQWAAAEIEVLHTFVSELYYDTSGESRVRYASRVSFRSPSIDSLNTFYRILSECWSGNAPRPVEPQES